MTDRLPQRLQKQQRRIGARCFACCLWAWLAAAHAAPPTATEGAAANRLKALVFPVGEPVSFHEQQFNPLVREPISSHGQVQLEADGTMVMTLREPRVEQRRLKDRQLTLLRPARGARAGVQAPAFSQVQRRLQLRPERATHLILLAAAALLHGEHDWLQQRFSLSVAALTDRTEGAERAVATTPTWELLLVPIEPSVRAQLSWIRLTGSDTQLQSLRADRGPKGWQQLDFFADGN